MEKALRLALLAAFTRILVAPFFGHLWDVKTLQETVYYTLRGENVYALVYTLSRRVSESTGLPLFYEGYAYLPHLTLILIPFYAAYIALGGNPQPIRVFDSTVGVTLLYEQQFYLVKDVFLFMLLIKMPMIIADSTIVYMLAKRNERIALIYALSPYSILITGMWGMFDSLVALSLIMSIALAERGRYMLSGLAYGFSLIKLYSIVTLPVLLLALRGKGYNAILSFTLGFLLSQIPSIAYLALDPISFTYTVLVFHLFRQPSGLTPLRMLTISENTTITSLISTVHTIVSIVAYMAIVAYIARNNIDLKRGVTVTLLYFLAFSKTVHEQYYLSVYPMLLELRSREARILEILILTYGIVNVGLFIAAPTLLFLVDYRILSIHSSIVYGDLGYITINIIGPLVGSILATLFFIVTIRVVLKLLDIKF